MTEEPNYAYREAVAIGRLVRRWSQHAMWNANTYGFDIWENWPRVMRFTLSEEVVLE